MNLVLCIHGNSFACKKPMHFSASHLIGTDLSQIIHIFIPMQTSTEGTRSTALLWRVCSTAPHLPAQPIHTELIHSLYLQSLYSLSPKWLCSHSNEPSTVSGGMIRFPHHEVSMTWVWAKSVCRGYMLWFPLWSAIVPAVVSGVWRAGITGAQTLSTNLLWCWSWASWTPPSWENWC